MDDGDIINGYRARQIERGLSDDTLSAYLRTYRAFVEWCRTSGLTLTTISEDDVRAWLHSGKRTAVTRNQYLSRLDLLFRWMRDEQLRADVPTLKIPKAKTPRSVPRPLPTSGLHRALELADPRTRLMLALAAYAGLRRAEIAALRREDILDDPRPLLRVLGKGSKTRHIPIGPVVAAALAEYGLPETGPLFPGQCCKPISRHTVGEIVSGHLRACGVDATTHQGRHWFLSQLYAETLDLRICQEMAGHASPVTTQIYAAWSPDRAAAGIAALPARAEGPPEAA